MKTDVNQLSITALMDLLAEKTRRMTQMLADKEFGPDYEECKEELAELVSAIELRKEKEK